MNTLNLKSSGLSEGDLDFIVREAAPEFRDKAKLKQLIREDRDFRNGLVESERVFKKVMADEEIILKISPGLYFEILLRRALKELEKAGYTIERVETPKVAVFDTEEIIRLFSHQAVLEYLVNMLSSFIKIESYAVGIRIGRGIWRKVKFNDMDIDSLGRFCEAMDEEYRFGFYKRIADVCLFILGIFPEYVQFDYRYPLSGEERPKIMGRTRRSAEDYEIEGRKFYKLAGEHPLAEEFNLADVLLLLHEKFTVAKKPLNFISEHYLHYKKHKLFGMEE